MNFFRRRLTLKKIISGPRRSPLIHAMYFMRYHTINTILDHLLSKFNQFLILGAGTDTSFWRLNIAEKPQIKWFEIDFPENLEMKRNLMEKHYGVASNYIPGKIQKYAKIYTGIYLFEQIELSLISGFRFAKIERNGTKIDSE